MSLAAVIDLFSRKVVGWSMSERIDSRLVVDALEMAVSRELPDAGLVAHSDRGVQYASEHYQGVLAQHGLECSMSRKGDCWDNAVAESFFSSLKRELVEGLDILIVRELTGGVYFGEPKEITTLPDGSKRAVDTQVYTTGEIDRFYFRSLYFREPGGVLFELATDGPGFAQDEPAGTMGEALSLPPQLEPRRAEIEAQLKPID